VTASTNGPTAEIDLAAISHNLNIAKAASPKSKVMAVIKADAYGHGLVPVGQSIESADALGVARLVEAVELREAGIDTPITLLEGFVDSSELELIAKFNLDLVIHSEHQLSLLQGCTGLRLWLKLETGMNRLGLSARSIENAISRLGMHKILGLMGHLANADDQLDSAIDNQLEAFHSVADRVELDRSLANSAALLAHSRTHFDWNRPGLMLYGASPFRDLNPITSLQPAMKLSAPIIAIKQLEAGDSVGYGSLWVARKSSLIAVVGIGYGDGYPREISDDTQIFVKGSRRGVVGRVSMDMMTIELKTGDEFSIGDRVELWGQNIPIEEIARCAGTIPYTVMCGVTKRVPRIYTS
jgi:alanine racemase